MIALTWPELQHWLEETSCGWKGLIQAHPEVLSIACDIRETESVAQLLQHVVAVELRYAERLNGLPETAYDLIPYDSAEAIYATHDRAMKLLQPLMALDDSFWEAILEFQSKSAGTLRATRRTMLVHLALHAVRHYAQLATIVRKQGVVPDFAMDYIFMRAGG
jgi:uncharacterized damage-inducible protein DinB